MKMMDQVGISRLKEIPGHESIAITERYLHADIEDLRRSMSMALGRLHWAYRG